MHTDIKEYGHSDPQFGVTYRTPFLYYAVQLEDGSSM
jgi:hypothetical protein